MADPLSREHAAELDAADPLASFRERFVVTDPERIYLDGNSLGRLPLATRDRLRDLVDEWGDRLVSGWQDWIDAPARVGDALAEGVLGARPGEVIVSDSTTVNLFKLCSAARRRRCRTATTRRRRGGGCRSAYPCCSSTASATTTCPSTSRATSPRQRARRATTASWR